MDWTDFLKNTPTTSTATPVEDKAIVERIEERLIKIKQLFRDNRMNQGSLQMWTAFLREQLIQIYGKNSEIAKLLPPIRKKLSPEIAYEIASALTEQAETFLGYLKQAGHLSFPVRKAGKVFIGHGCSLLWRELKDFLSERLGLGWDEFNQEAVAGFTTFERLSQMLSEATFAFLIMTAEEEHMNKSLHARENVVHEVGLFQGRLGQRRAIILLEEGCKEFSNIVGLSQIRFPKGHISSAFEDIRRVLEREGII